MIKIKDLSFFVLLIILISLTFNGYSQKTIKFEDYNIEFKKGIELFNKEKYGSAQKYFEDIVNKYKGLNYNNDFRSDAEYLSAICAIELFNKDAEYLLINFINENPESPRIKSSYFQMGKYQYRKKRYNKAIEWFEKIDKYDLNNTDLAEFYFKLGYSHFVMEDFEKASKAFYEIKDSDTEYSVPAIYYYSHIAYNNKNYENALMGFEKLSNNVTFAPIVPYYITQIYYYQNKYDKVIEYAKPLLESANTKRQPEIARIIGESYYRTNKFENAIYYLEYYRERTEFFSQDDNYELGYAYYRTKNYSKAKEFLVNATKENNIITQNAFYHLGDCYLKLEDKNSSRLSFASAGKMEFDKLVKEDAIYNYAKLTYELSISPFNEAIKAFYKYIELYPNSEKHDEIYGYLAQVFMTTKNYKDAIESFENIKKVTDDIEAAYQKVTYFRGLELFNDLKFSDAIINFDKSLNNSKYNETYKAMSLYWRGEAYYRLKRYNEAINSYNQFLLSPRAFGTEEFKIAHYNLGYCYFKQKDYSKAITWFRKYTSYLPDSKSKMIGDANIRIADSYFINKDFNNSIDFYNQAIKVNVSDIDYSLFQKGMCLGLLKEYNEKIIVLNKLINDYSKSSYCDDAMYELGRSYEAISENEMAISTYNKIIDEYPNSSYVVKSLLQLGMAYFNADNNSDALIAYKKILEKYPGTDEAKDALYGIKNVYVDNNDVDGYINYTKGLGNFANVSLSEQDSLIYITAEKVYMSGDCKNAIDKFTSYVEKFPTGSFIINSNYYLADCSYKAKEYEIALKGYKFVLQQGKTKFSEHALLNSARINYELGNYSEALINYSELEKIAEIKSNQLEAKNGKMKSAYYSKSYSESIKYAINVLLVEKLPDEIFRLSHYILAKSYLEQKDLISAKDELQLLSKDPKSQEGAEAYYLLAELDYKNKKYEAAEKLIFEFIEVNTPFQYWLGKAFILLADIYIDKQNQFQAKQTLQSIIDNYSNKTDGIIEIAKEKLELIIESEVADKQLKEMIDYQIKFDDNADGKYDKLFIEENKVLENENINLNDSIK